MAAFELERILSIDSRITSRVMELISAVAVTIILSQLTKNCKSSARRNEESRMASRLSCLQRHVWESLVKSKINLRA